MELLAAQVDKKSTGPSFGQCGLGFAKLESRLSLQMSKFVEAKASEGCLHQHMELIACLYNTHSASMDGFAEMSKAQLVLVFTSTRH